MESVILIIENIGVHMVLSLHCGQPEFYKQRWVKTVLKGIEKRCSNEVLNDIRKNIPIQLLPKKPHMSLSFQTISIYIGLHCRCRVQVCGHALYQKRLRRDIRHVTSISNQSHKQTYSHFAPDTIERQKGA